MAKRPERSPYLGGGSFGEVPKWNHGNVLGEIGSSGLRAFSGYIREEFVTNLIGRQAATVYRERRGGYEFLTREQRWVSIPEDRITFLPVPGDPPSDDSHHAHLCYRPALDSDREGAGAANVFDGIYLFCAFIPPGSI